MAILGRASEAESSFQDPKLPREEGEEDPRLRPKISTQSDEVNEAEDEEDPKGPLFSMPGKRCVLVGQRAAGSSTAPPRHWRTKASEASVRGRAVSSSRIFAAKPCCEAPAGGGGRKWPLRPPAIGKDGDGTMFRPPESVYGSLKTTVVRWR